MRKEYYEQNKIRIADKNRRYRLQHLEEIRERERKYYQDYRAKNRAYQNDMARKNYRKNHIQRRLNTALRRAKNRNNLLLIISDDGVHIRCVECHYDTDLAALQIEHKNDDGAVDRKRFGGTCNNYDIHKMIWYYLNHPEEARQKLQILCANCNSIKQRRLLLKSLNYYGIDR
jgi:hypothetical protein